MKYYLIFEASLPGTKRTRPTYVVEHENIAKAFCKEFSGFYYEERDDGQYIFASDTICADKFSDDNSIDINPLSKGLYDNIKCPHCGASYFKEGPSFTTAMYFQPIWKDGKNINPDRNTTTTECECLNCGKKFKLVNGEVVK